jgi:GGDEF domain-containing protein
VPYNETIIRPTASVGVAALSPRRATREALLLSAERALDQARVAGGNRTVVAAGDAGEERRARAAF